MDNKESTGEKPGFNKDEIYTMNTLSLQRNDIIFLSTDGIIDMTGNNAETAYSKGLIKNRYGYERLERFLIKQDWNSAEQLKTAALEDVRSHQGASTQDDDISMLVMRL